MANLSLLQSPLLFASLFSSLIPISLTNPVISKFDCAKYCHQDCYAYYPREPCFEANLYCECGFSRYTVIVIVLVSAYCCVFGMYCIVVCCFAIFRNFLEEIFNKYCPSWNRIWPNTVTPERLTNHPRPHTNAINIELSFPTVPTISITPSTPANRITPMRRVRARANERTSSLPPYDEVQPNQLLLEALEDPPSYQEFQDSLVAK